jgi:hypothetical protein
MARYYFDIHESAQSVRDDEGSEFDSVDAAVQTAARSAAEIGTVAVTMHAMLASGQRFDRSAGLTAATE